MSQDSTAITTKASSLAAQVRADIIRGVFPPGSKLPTKDLSDRYGVSLIPMREALSRLASSGFVVAEDQRGFRVAAVSATELTDITNVRVFVEQEALRRSITHGDLDWEAKLISIHHRLGHLPLRDGQQLSIATEWEQAHDAFHAALLAACDSKWLLNLSQILREQSTRYRHISVRAGRSNAATRRNVAAEHRALLDAALKRDALTATELLARHFLTTKELVLESTAPPDAANTPAAAAHASVAHLER